MTPDELAFYQAMSADPDDDLLRLSFADWLDEHDRRDRAEFIRLQVERFRRGASVPPSSRERHLFAMNADEWLQEVPTGFRGEAEFARGFVRKVRGEAAALLTNPPQVVIAPVEEMTILVGPLQPAMEFVQPPPLTLPLRSLAIECQPFVGPALAVYLAMFGPYPRLERLRIQDFMFGDEGVGLIRPDPTFPRLTALDLSHCGIGDAGADTLVDSDWPNRLTELRLTGNHLSAAAVARLRDKFDWALVL